MVAKLKTSFLKSGFQFFCHRSPFAVPSHATNNPTKQSQQSARINSSSQFSSSPDLTLPTKAADGIATNSANKGGEDQDNNSFAKGMIRQST
jgi:hypothetical protein